MMKAPNMNAACLTLCMISAGGALGCAGGVEPTGDLDTYSADDIGATEAAVENGNVMTPDDYNGVVRLWNTNSQFHENRQYCTGVLLRNNLVVTAAHCVRRSSADVAYGWPQTAQNVGTIGVTTDRGSFVSAGIGAPLYAPDGRDLAVFKLATPLPVRWHGEVSFDNYSHPLSGTPAATAALAVVGYGPPGDPTSTICNYVGAVSHQRLKGCLGDQVPLNYRAGRPRPNGVEMWTIGVTSTGGDSGGPTVVVTPGASGMSEQPLVGINSEAYHCVQTGPTTSECGAVSARTDDMVLWLSWLR